MGCSRSFTDHKDCGALHDTGKIGVDDAVLRKARSAFRQEFDLIKQPPVVGRRIIESINLSSVVNDAVLYHHRGTTRRAIRPEGPAAGELPLSAAILP
jgi:response regulator RpfG family c-di-GMP phosphodiesterase